MQYNGDFQTNLTAKFAVILRKISNKEIKYNSDYKTIENSQRKNKSPNGNFPPFLIAIKSNFKIKYKKLD